MVISDILLFVRIAETLSFKDAARHLGMSKSQVSKRIAALEAGVGARLIYRSTRSISLTAAGETLLGYYRHIFDTMEEAKLAVESLSKTCSGRLRFSMPTCMGTALLPELHGEFLARHPGIVLDTHTSDNCVDIVAGGYDVVIRIAQRLCDSTLTARRLASSPLVVAAAPTYLARRGVPVQPADLARHQCLGLHAPRPGGAVWQLQRGSERFNESVNVTTTSDTNLALISAARAGLGIVYLPMCSIASELRQGRLQAVLTEYCADLEWGVHAVHAGRQPSRNGAAFIEFVRDSIATLDGIDASRPHARRAVVHEAMPRPIAGSVQLLDQDSSAGFQ